MKSKTKKIIATLGILTVAIGSIFSFAGCGKDKSYDKYAIFKTDGPKVIHRATYLDSGNFNFKSKCGLIVYAYGREYSGYIDITDKYGINSRYFNGSITKIKDDEQLKHAQYDEVCEECFPKGIIIEN